MRKPCRQIPSLPVWQAHSDCLCPKFPPGRRLQDFIPASAGLPDAAFDAPRKADAIVLAPQGVQPGASVPAVLFCHGFSQPPTNYLSTLKLFAEQVGRRHTGRQG